MRSSLRFFAARGGASPGLGGIAAGTHDRKGRSHARRQRQGGDKKQRWTKEKMIV